MASREYVIAQAAQGFLETNTSAVAVDLGEQWTDVERGDTDLPRITLQYLTTTRNATHHDAIDEMVLTATYQASVPADANWLTLGDAMAEELRSAFPMPSGVEMGGWPDYLISLTPLERPVARGQGASNLVEAVSRWRVRFANRLN